jgi:two-component system, NtrC family, response regulator HydG
MRKSVLLAEDDKMTQKFLVQKLIARFEVQTTESASETISLLLTRKFDLLVLDFMLTDGTGMDVLKFMRQQGITTPVVVLSANTDPAIVKETKQMGISSYLSKEQPLSDLVEGINKALLAIDT